MANLQDQIRQTWGQYGDWNAAGQDQVDALARLLQLNGVQDLSQFKLTARDEAGTPQLINQGDNDPITVMGDPRTVFDATYGGQKLGYLGDINSDGNAHLREIKSDYDRQTGPYDEQGRRTELSGNGDLLGWSGAGGGHTGFHVTKGPDGNPVVVPVWGSSSQGTYDDIRSIASMVALAAGGYYAPAGGTTGAMAQGALKGYAGATAAGMAGDGDANSIVKGQLIGMATGAAGAGINSYGAEQGWNPAATRAAAAGATTAARGGDARDIGAAALTGGANGMEITGNSAVDQALVRAGSTYLKGGDTRDALTAGLISGGGSLLNQGGSGNTLTTSGSNNVADDYTQLGQDWGLGDNFTGDATLDDYLKNIDWSGGGGFQGDGLDMGGTSTSGTDWSKILGNLLGGKNGNNTGSNLAGLLGALLGAQSSKSGNTTVSKDPWAPAQPYLKGLLSEGADLYGKYKAQPFSQAQQSGYGNVGGLLDLVNSNAGGLLSGFQANAMGTNQFARGRPQQHSLVGSSFAPQDSQWNPGKYFDFGTRG